MSATASAQAQGSGNVSRCWTSAGNTLARWSRWTARNVHWWLAAIAVLAWLQTHFVLGINATQSLPGKVYLVERGVQPAKGEVVAFHWTGGGGYAAGHTFLKRIVGVAGDRIDVQGRDVLVNGALIATAKVVSQKGEPLAMIAPGEIPTGYVFVRGDHVNSLDSRYALCGLIPVERVLGRGHELF